MAASKSFSRGTGTPLATSITRPELKAYLRRLDAFVSPLVYTFWDDQGTPSIMTLSAALAEYEGALCVDGYNELGHNEGACDPIVDSHAPSGPRQLLRGKTRPQGCKPQGHLRRAAEAIRRPFAHHEGASDSPL